MSNVNEVGAIKAQRNQVNFYIKAFGMQLSMVPSFPVLIKLVKGLDSDLPKKIKDFLKTDGLVPFVKAYVEKNTLLDAVNGLEKWLKEAEESLSKADDDLFESKRGKDVSGITVELWGVKCSVPEMAINLLQGSKLAEILAKGPGENFTPGNWEDLHQTLNTVNSVINQIVPQEFKPKRNKKGTEDAKEDPKVDPSGETKGDETNEGDGVSNPDPAVDPEYVSPA